MNGDKKSWTKDWLNAGKVLIVGEEIKSSSKSAFLVSNRMLSITWNKQQYRVPAQLILSLSRPSQFWELSSRGRQHSEAASMMAG